MSLKSKLKPRPSSQRETVGKRASKLWTIRALERDRARALPAPVRPPKPLLLTADTPTTERAFWRRLPLLSRDPATD